MAIKNNNVAVGLPANGKFKVGRSDVDKFRAGLELGALLPVPSNVEATWLYYDCAIGVMMDSGIVVHNRLPQVDNEADTLASCDLDDPNLDKLTGFGVNLKCRDQYKDIVQRMGHARYWFRLWGQALRVGHQVPIPRIKTIGGVPAIPYDKNPQWAYNTISPNGNYSGVVIWRAQWSLWYTTAVPPTSNKIPVANPSAHISADTKMPKGIQTPFSQRDDNAQTQAPPQKLKPKPPKPGGGGPVPRVGE